MNEDEIRSVMADLEEAYRSDPWYRHELTKLANGWADIQAGAEEFPIYKSRPEGAK